MDEFVDNNTIDRHGKGTSGKAARIRARRQRMFDDQKGLCHWCKQLMSMDQLKITPRGRIKYNRSFATFEHLIPKSEVKKMKHKPKNNIVLAHGTCNGNRHRRKWDHDPIYGSRRGTPPSQPRQQRDIAEKQDFIPASPAQSGEFCANIDGEMK